MVLPLQVEFGVRYGVQQVTRDIAPRYPVRRVIVRGRWASQPKIASANSGKSLLEYLINNNHASSQDDYSAAQGIVEFTRRWGPLFTEYEPDKDFCEDVAKWRWEQSELTRLWSLLGRTAAPHHWPTVQPILPTTVYHLEQNIDSARNRLLQNWDAYFLEKYSYFPAEDERLDDFGRTGPKGHLRIGARTILRFAKYMLYAIDARYLRFCWRPDCTTRYFIAEDLKAHYCSEPCSDWSRSEWKRSWWRDHGNEWRRARGEPEQQHRKKRRKK